MNPKYLVPTLRKYAIGGRLHTGGAYFSFQGSNALIHRAKMLFSSGTDGNNDPDKDPDKDDKKDRNWKQRYLINIRKFNQKCDEVYKRKWSRGSIIGIGLAISLFYLALLDTTQSQELSI